MEITCMRDLEKRKAEIKQEMAESKALISSKFDMSRTVNDKLGLFSRNKKNDIGFLKKPANWFYMISGVLIVVGLRRRWKFIYNLAPVAMRYIVPLLTDDSNQGEME